MTSFFSPSVANKVYGKFIENLMTDCNKLKKAESMPIAFEAVNGKLDFDFKLTTASAYIYS
jgi:hypothetical protein